MHAMDSERKGTRELEGKRERDENIDRERVGKRKASEGVAFA